MRHADWSVGVPAFVALLLAACAPPARVVTETGPATVEPPSMAETPARRDPSVNRDFLEKSVFRPLNSTLNLARFLRGRVAPGVEAYNVNSRDDVDDSEWFTHRNSRRRLTPAEVARGPLDAGPPDTTGDWTVLGAKVQGITPGLRIEDARGVRYLLKFDPPGYPQLMTAAEAISSRLFHAAGYHVPGTFVTVFDPERVRAAEGLTLKDELGRERQVSDAALRSLLRGISQRSDGRVRAVASQFLRGALGPFSYEGTRQDDPVDTIPHEHRRELRGLYVMAAWLNHLDTKQHNSLDVLVEEEDGRRYIRHYLIDFGSTLGSAGIRSNTPRDGVEHDIDLSAIARRGVTLGFYASPWERFPFRIEHPSIGFFSSALFDPGDWRNNYPNPAFERLTTRDGYWGARLVASFDEAQIRAAVSAGQLSDSAAAEALVGTILERRRLTLRYWYARVTPLEELSVAGPASRARLAFQDPAAAEGVAAGNRRTYDVRLSLPGLGLEARWTETAILDARGNGALTLDPPWAEDPDFWARLDRLPLDKRVAVCEVTADPGEPGRRVPRSARIYLLPDRAVGYRIVGRAY